MQDLSSVSRDLAAHTRHHTTALAPHEQSLAMGKNKLGDTFWGQFYRLDKTTYTEEKFHEEVAKLGLHRGPKLIVRAWTETMLDG